MGWSDKYKKSIDCSNPKGFSQRAHCQGKKKKMNEEKKGPCPKTGEAVCKCKKNESLTYTDFLEAMNLPPAGNWLKFRRDGPGKKKDRKPQPYRIKNTEGKRLPSAKKESMDFSEYMESLVNPLYEKEGDVPKCPPGYRFDKRMMMCVPKTAKDSVGPSQQGGKDLKPSNGAGYHVIGNSGYSGAGYAFEEPPTSNDLGSGTDGSTY